MSDDTRDPRLEVLVDIVCEEGDGLGTETAAQLLARLDAADPLRALWGEMVEALDRLAHDEENRVEYDYPPEVRGYKSYDQRYQRDKALVREYLDLLTRARARALDATNQGGDDE